jgi:hypothetical protein
MRNLPEGVWNDEPEALWFEANGFKCQVARHMTQGHLCGYIQVDKTHPWYGKDYDNVDVRVHGGLTFARNIPDHTTFGFDCAHLGDLVPAMPPLSDDETLFNRGDVYRDFGYVVNQLISLAKQAKDAANEQR